MKKTRFLDHESWTHNGQQDPELQLRELHQYCEHRGWQITPTDTGSMP
jgi:hypothetical protein